MAFERYQHVERFGTDPVDGIEMGECYVFPKIDGTNASVWFDDEIRCGSRNRELSLDNDNAGFMAHILDDSTRYQALFGSYPGVTLYGEWLVPHSLKDYRDDAWRKFYVFDVVRDEEHISYPVYKEWLDEFGIAYIPPLGIIRDGNHESFLRLAESNTYLLKDGAGPGEGVVIKRYDFKNRYGRQVWAKIVLNTFKDKHAAAMQREILAANSWEQRLAEAAITPTLIAKEKAKIEAETGGWESRHIARLLGTVHHCVVTEELWPFLKANKRDSIIIDFKQLHRWCIETTKRVCPEMF